MNYSRTLILVVAGTLIGSAAQAQAPLPLPPASFSPEAEVVTFGIIPWSQRAATPPLMISIDRALSCPMPVLRDNRSNDTPFVAPMGVTRRPLPMPGTGTDALSGCDNPLDRPAATP